MQPYQASREKPDSPRLHATLKVSLPEELSSDDELDAVVGLINLLDLASGHGDIFGTFEHGYFLVPARHSRPSWRELWKRAAEAHPVA